MIQAFLLKLVRFQLPIWLVMPLLGLTFLIGIGGGYISAFIIAPSTNCPESDEVCEEFGVYWQAWDLASENFVDPSVIEPETMITGSVNGMLNTLGDQGHTRFLSAEEANRWNQSLAGEYEGIGAYLDIHDGQAIIVEPIEGSPAEKAGLQSGDFILKIDGKDTYGMALDEVASTIRGEKGTTVVLTIQRPGDVQEFDVSVKRATVEIPSVQWAMLPNDIALIYLDSFASRSADEMEAALKEAQEQGAKQLILDIRNNGGGLVNEAIGIASQFLPEGTPVLLEQGRDGDREVSKARSGGVALDIPMVVLINFHTASSAEILSGALQDQERAPLIGVRTVGTGTVLTPYELDGGAKLLLGTQQWLTPNGRTIRNQGISPDIELALPVDVAPLSPREAAALSEDGLMESEDVQLVKAIEVLLEQ